MIIGAQLYTVRHSCKTLDDFAETLRKIADIGYTTVQVSGTCAYSPEWLKEELKKTGLRCVITHNDRDRLITDTAGVIADHDIFDCRYVGLGSPGKGYHFDPDEPEHYTDFVREFVPVAEAIRQSGKYFMYHNHAREFDKSTDGRIYMERLAEDFAPEQMGFTLDTYWVQVGGGDPAAWIEKLSGRVPCIHLKDCSYGPRMEWVGGGNINFDRIFEKAEATGTEYMLVEQDDCNGEDPFECLKKSYDFLASRGFK